MTSNRNDILRWSLSAVAFLLPLSQFLSVRVLVLVAVFALIEAVISRRVPQVARNSWDLWLYLIVLAAGLIYSDNLSAGLRTLETSFSLFAVSLVFGAIIFDRMTLRQVQYSFVFGLLAACAICLSYAGYRYIQTGDLRYFFYDRLTEVLEGQPTYLAYYLIFAIGFLLYSLFYWESKFRAYALAAMTLFFFAMLMLSGGRTAFISLILIFSFFILKFLLEEKNRHHTLVFVIVCILTPSLFIVNTLDYWNEQWAVESDYWQRDALWISALEANPSPLFGVGTGDHTTVLNDYYREHGLEEFAANSFNAHNQFIQIYFSNGLFGLIAIALILIRPLYFALRSGDTSGVLIIFPFFIYGMTEVFLGRYQGVAFFAILHQLVVSRYYVAGGTWTLKTPE